MVVQTFVHRLGSRFSIKDPSDFSYFLGVKVISCLEDIRLTRKKYLLDILTKHNMKNSKPIQKLLATSFSTQLHDGSPPLYAILYRHTVGSLDYLLISHPDIIFSVNKLSQFMHAPMTHHCDVVKYLFRYLNGTQSYGIQLLRHNYVSARLL